MSLLQKLQNLFIHTVDVAILSLCAFELRAHTQTVYVGYEIL